MNAPQFGAAANGPATPTANSSPFNFLTAGSTNPAIPDFKTVAAALFPASTTTTASVPAATKSTTVSKPTGQLLPHDREGDKENDAQGSELPSAFLPMLPWHPLPTLAPQAPNHAQPMPLAQPTQAKENSGAPICVLPVANQAQDLSQIPSQSMVGIMTRNIVSMQGQQNPKDVEATFATPSVPQRDIKDIDASEKPTKAVKTDEKVPSRELLSSSVTTDSGPLQDIKNVGTAEKQQAAKTEVKSQAQIFNNAAFATGKTQPPAQVVTGVPKTWRMAENKENVVPAGATAVGSAGDTEIDTRQTTGNAFGRQFAKAERPATSAEHKKPSETKQPIETAQSDTAGIVQPSLTEEPDQPSAQQAATPQSLDDAIKAVIPQAVVLGHSVDAQALHHLANGHFTQSVKSVTNKSTEAESTSVGVSPSDTATPEKVPTDAPNTIKTLQAVEPNPKANTAKSKTESTVKKAQQTSTETQSEAATASTASHRPEISAVGSSQNATNKNPDAVTPQVNIGAHAKAASAKDTPETSDLAAPSANQILDADDITPPSHAGINTAKLVQSLTQSELRVGLQTRDFGNIDIRTSTSRHEFSAQISVEHSEVAHMLTSELPNLYARLNEQQVPVSNIHIHDQSLSTSSGLDQRSQQSSQQPQSGGFTRQQMEPALPAVYEVFSSTDRLDIRV